MSFMWLPGKDEAETCTKWCRVVHLPKEESFQLPWKHKHRPSVYPGCYKSLSSARSMNILGSNLTITSTETWIYSQCYLSRNMRGYDCFVFFMTWANSCSGTREGNWGSPLSLRSLFPGSFVREQDTGQEMTCWLAAIIIQAYCSEQVVQLVYNNSSWTIIKDVLIPKSVSKRKKFTKKNTFIKIYLRLKLY